MRTGSIGRSASVLQFLHWSNLINKDSTIVSLTKANLRELKMQGVFLLEANLTDANLQDADLGTFTVSYRGGSFYEHTVLQNASLQGADLRDAALSGAILAGAELQTAVLDKANLAQAVLGGANLRNAQGVTNEQLAQQALSLEGATMPNGQKYENWLMSREEGGEGG